MKVTDIIETVVSGALDYERIKRGYPLGSPGNGTTFNEYPHVNTGTDHDGSTLVQPGQIVSGVDNGKLLGGIVVVVLLIAAFTALALD